MTNSTMHFANAQVQSKGMTMRDAENFEEPAAAAPEGNESSATQAQEVDWAKRHSDLKSHTDKKENKYKEELAAKDQMLQELQKQLKEKSKASLPSSDEEVDEWKNNYPKVFDIVTTIVRKEKQSEVDELKQEVTELRNALGSYAQVQGRVELKKVHPDAEEIEASPEFAVWLEEQPSAIQSLASGGVRDVAKLLTIFKQDMGLTPAALKQQVREDSRAVSTHTNAQVPEGKKIWKESEIGAISNPRALEKALAEFEKARAEGRVEFDISGKTF